MLLQGLGAVGSALLGAAAAEIFHLFTSPGQAVRDAQAVQGDAERRQAEKDPLAISVLAYNDDTDDAYSWILPAPLSAGQAQRLLQDGPGDEIPRLTESTSGARVMWGRWGSEDRPCTRIRISTVGQATGPVLVHAIQAEVRHRSAPLAGAIINAGSQGGGEVMEWGFNLDEDHGHARVRLEDGTLGEPYLQRNSMTIAPGEVVVVDVQGHTATSYCEWIILMELEVNADGHRFPWIITDGGRPFRSTAEAKYYQSRYDYNPATQQWEALGPGPMS